MPRKSRIEFAGAVYHVLNRGNYRRDLFTQTETADAFETCLFEAAARCRWKLYAYVLMSNHYHLAIETPEPNLVAGMKWLQSTFASRFNRFRDERGHVFQGRYKAILVEENSPLAGLIDYIHLNPVRAGLCDVAHLGEYKHSSYARYWRRKPAAALDRETVLSLHGLSNSLHGMRGYERRLELMDEAQPDKREILFKKYCRGWFLGSTAARRQLARELVEKTPLVDWEGTDLADLNQARWELVVCAELTKRKKTEEDVRRDAKGADWKVEIARRLRRETTASNPWIARRLNMGHPSRVSTVLRTS